MQWWTSSDIDAQNIPFQFPDDVYIEKLKKHDFNALKNLHLVQIITDEHGYVWNIKLSNNKSTTQANPLKYKK